MSDRLSDSDLDKLRADLRSVQDNAYADPILADLLVRIAPSLLDEVREARENRGKVLAYDLDQADIEHRERDAVELVEARARIAELEAQVERIQTDREAWARRSRQQHDRIGRALYPVRQKRASGEPSRDDATEIECLVRRIEKLEHANRARCARREKRHE